MANETLLSVQNLVKTFPIRGGFLSREVASVKAVSDVYAPVSGSVLEVNDVLPDNPETINDDPYGDGWIIRVEMTDKDDLKDLMTAEEYADYVDQQKEDNEDEEDEEEEDEDEEEK